MAIEPPYNPVSIVPRVDLDYIWVRSRNSAESIIPGELDKSSKAFRDYIKAAEGLITLELN